MYQYQINCPEAPLRGNRYLKQLAPMLARLHDIGTERDKAHNRELFYDQYVSLLLLYFFNPTVTSLRGLQKSTDLAKVREQVGCRRVSRGSLSEAGTVFDPEALHQIFIELSQQIGPAQMSAQQEILRTLTAVDGSLLPALPRMVWALWQDEKHRAAKLHLHFEVGRGIPIDASITAGSGSEMHELRQHLESGRLYVLDRGYASWRLMNDILTARSSFIVRVKEGTAFTVENERIVSAAARKIGVMRDTIIARLGSSHHKLEIHQPLRLIEISTSKAHLFLLTDRLDLDAEIIALAYRYRWSVELFFRWLKCILGCRHWLGESINALTIQIYVALIATLLLNAWTNRKPSKRTFEMVSHFFSGWASEQELREYFTQLNEQKSGP